MAKELVDQLPDLCREVWVGTGTFLHSESFEASNQWSGEFGRRETQVVTHTLNITSDIQIEDRVGATEPTSRIRQTVSGGDEVKTTLTTSALCGEPGSERTIPNGHEEEFVGSTSFVREGRDEAWPLVLGVNFADDGTYQVAASIPAVDYVIRGGATKKIQWTFTWNLRKRYEVDLMLERK